MRGVTVAAVSPGGTSVRSRVRTIVVWVVVLVVVGAVASLLGWDVRGWVEHVWDTMTTISRASLVAAVCVKTLGTTATAFAWYSILRFGYPGEVRWLHVLAAYAASVALNGILPANLGTLVLLIMLTQLIASASFAGVLGAYGVEKIFFCLIGVVPYLYLFLSVGGSFDLRFGFVSKHTLAFVIMLAGGAWLLYLVGRQLWPRITGWWGRPRTAARSSGGRAATCCSSRSPRWLPGVPGSP